MQRSFISFSFGGKPIEDFQLIATLDGRLNKNIYSDFEDTTSDYTTMDGQYYWGTRMSPNALEFTLSTDYMTQQTLDEFKYWFKPGAERDLILAEHPNRYIRARVAVAPSINVIPFGEEAIVKIEDSMGQVKEYKTMTTIYKGDISLSLTMDEPYWHGILNYMPYPGMNINENADSRLVELMNNIIDVNSLTSQDALKICLEDQLPHDLALHGDSAFFGVDAPYADAIISCIYFEDTLEKPYPTYVGQSRMSYLHGAMTDISHTDNADSAFYQLTETAEGLSLNMDTPRYLFYSGTAPSKPIIKFTMELSLDDDGYITNPINSIAQPDGTEHSYIKIGNNYFYFTTPSICTHYNKALKIIEEADSSKKVVDIRKQFREQLKNKYAREWALYCLKKYDLNDSATAIAEEFKVAYKRLFTPKARAVNDYENKIRYQEIYYEADFMFNSKTGEAKGFFHCRTLAEPQDGEEIIENVGDMVLSKYPIIDERNYLTANGLVIAGGENNNCTEITTNENLSHFSILYDNMYF